MELHPEELQLSGDEESPEAGRDDQDKGLKIRRTVTQVRAGLPRHPQAPEIWVFVVFKCCFFLFELLFQVVPSESHENGQANEEEEMETAEEDSQHRDPRDKRKDSVCEEAPGAQAPTNEAEAEKGEPPPGGASFQACSNPLL